MPTTCRVRPAMLCGRIIRNRGYDPLIEACEMRLRALVKEHRCRSSGKWQKTAAALFQIFPLPSKLLILKRMLSVGI